MTIFFSILRRNPFIVMVLFVACAFNSSCEQFTHMSNVKFGKVIAKDGIETEICFQAYPNDW